MGSYVNFGPQETQPPPVVCREVVLYTLFVEAEYEALKRLCCEVFNPQKDPKISCQPADDYFVVQFSNIGWVGNAAYRAGVKEMEVLVQVPVYYDIYGHSGEAYFTPYIWVSNPLAMAGGREVFGYPKGLGCLTVPRPRKHSPALRLSLQTYGGDKDYSGVWPDDLEQIAVQETGQFHPASDLITYWSSKLHSERSKALLRSLIIQQDYQTIFLKQFRDVRSTVGNETACFKQIVAAQYSVTDPSRPDWQPEPLRADLDKTYDLTIADFDSATMYSSLQPKRMSNVGQKAKFFHTVLSGCTLFETPSLTLDKPRVLWTSP